MSDLEDFHAHQAALHTVLGLIGGYRLTLDGPTIEVSHSALDADLPAYAIQVSTGDDALLIRSVEWADRIDDLEARVLAWLLARIDLRGVRRRTGARRAHPVWVEVWRRANPGRRT